MSSPDRHFNEREFYLAEFRQRSIGIAWPSGEAAVREPLASVIETLVANDTRVVLLSPQEEILSLAGEQAPIDFDSEGFAPQLWRALRAAGSAGLRVDERGFEEACCRAALALRLAKVVWVRGSAPIARRDGGRPSVVDLAHLEPLVGEPGSVESAPSDSNDEGVQQLVVRPEDRTLLVAIREMIECGVPAVNVCGPKELAEELFTYAGAGTFFTRDRYAEVRALALDDFDPASDLMRRGEEDGFLVPRGDRERDAILANGVGVFIEGRYLAGIGAILPYPEANAVEIASLYALTRYVGEGVGSQIVRYALARARAQGLDYVFSCTTSDRVERFFARHGFERVAPDALPARKWADYAPDRLKRVRCLRFDSD